GNGFAVFDKQNTPQLKSNDIRALLPATKNVLFVSTAAGLTRLHHGEWKTFTTADGLPGDDVETAYEDRDGTLWVGTAAGLARLRDGAFTSYTTRDGLAGDSVQAIFQDKAGALWVGTRDGLSKFEDGRFTNYAAREGLPGGGVDAIRQSADGRLWLATPDGLASFADNRFTVYTTRDGLPNNRVISLHTDREGALWVGTAAGLGRLRENRFETYAAGEALSNGIVLSIFEDAEGSLWVGTESGGLHQLRDKKFTTYTARDGLAGDLVKSVYEDRRGQVWVGTYGGGLSLIARDGSIKTYTTKEGLASNIILALFDDAEGSLWVGTPDGLSKFRDGAFTTYTSADGLANDFVRSIYADRAGALWVGTRGGLTRMKDGAFTIYTTREGLADDFVGTIYEDAAGSIWAGTLGGLSKFKDGAFTSYTTRDGLSDNVVIALHGDAEGRLWIGTNGGGLNLLRGGKFTAFTTRDGLPHDTVYRILEDGAGNLWMSCNKGVFRVSKAELDDFAGGKTKTLSPVVYGTADGMPTRECSGGGHPSGWRDRAGRLWFSTIKGVAVIDPAGARTNAQPPPAVVEQVRVDGELVNTFGRKAELAPGKTRFDFHYAGLSFVAPEKVRYKYRLTGFDKDWVDGGARRVAYYTNLGPGDYRFEVLACNNDGVWSRAPAAFSFTLKPHFYRTPWFYALVVAALALVAAQVYLLRVRQMKARFAAVLQERNRIAREIHDNLAQEILGVSVQLELVARLMPRSTDAAKTHLDRARALVRSSIAEARRYVWDLRSQSLDDRDLATALAEMTRRLTAESGVQTQFQVSGTFRPLTPQVENNLLRIGQEAVNNAVRHARAQLITVNLSFDDARVSLSVRDDGRGFDPHNGAGGDGHFGIVGMRERAAEMGATLDVESRAGGGTEVLVGVPIEG
ncbi:MAG TPA: two-component regulator propeller domain-containing protein, partial [Pyrinomonadaceae bacterium]|nr:two-component regulator propeller domain-containing protein [Pyrinomonadaceae bacterium]